MSLAPHDPRWPALFAAESERLRERLGVEPDAIEHIGSTAVPDLIAKPIVDLMLGLRRYPPADALVAHLGTFGYEDLGEAGVAGRRYLRLRAANSFNLHVVERDGAHWTNNLRLRDFLRRDVDARSRYAAAKRAALEKADRLLAYSAAKQPALSALIAAASAN